MNEISDFKLTFGILIYFKINQLLYIMCLNMVTGKSTLKL